MDNKNVFSMLIIGATRNMLTPVKIRKDGPVTVVFWRDGTATSVRCGAGEQYDDYVAFCAALAKKLFLNNSSIKRILRDTPVEIVTTAPMTEDNKPAVFDKMKVVGRTYTFHSSSADVKDLD